MAKVYPVRPLIQGGIIFLCTANRTINSRFKTKALLKKDIIDLFFLMFPLLQEITINGIKIIQKNNATLFQIVITSKKGSKQATTIPPRLAYSLALHKNIPLYIEANLFEALAKR